MYILGQKYSSEKKKEFCQWDGRDEIGENYSTWGVPVVMTAIYLASVDIATTSQPPPRQSKILRTGMLKQMKILNNRPSLLLCVTKKWYRQCSLTYAEYESHTVIIGLVGPESPVTSHLLSPLTAVEVMEFEWPWSRHWALDSQSSSTPLWPLT